MIVYSTTKKQFMQDASAGIEDIIRQKIKEQLFIDIKPESSEYASWRNSLGNAMFHVMNTDKIPNDCGVAIEYSIPRTKNRIDFIITGSNEENKEEVIIIELKQWTEIEKTDKDAVVKTRFKYGLSEELHPSYQAWSYSTLLNDFNATVYNEKIGLEPCAYAHNADVDSALIDHHYKIYLDKAPIFCKHDKEKLQNFITKYIKYGDKRKTMYRIDHGEIRPSKSLSDSLVSMLKGNDEFVMIEDQKIIYETALSLAKKSTNTSKSVLIVEGGPGTGKSVVAVNLLVALTKNNLVNAYVTKNSAPRSVYHSMLTKSYTKTTIAHLFMNSGSFIDSDPNTFDGLIVDEAHRLNHKSGIFNNLGQSQIMEIINAAKFTMFLIDENQRVTWHDIGTKLEIELWAKKLGVNVTNMKLESQFRCNGSDGYLAWIDNILQINQTANVSLEDAEYNFQIVDSPNELRSIIHSKNANNKARMVAGYCWDWVSKNNKKKYDIVFPEFDFQAQWNFASDGGNWIIMPNSIDEIGCIHTCQGLELEYVGVIIGPDLIVRDGKVITDPSKRSKMDKSLKGYKKALKENPDESRKKADEIIRNTYRTLLTRGLKGCYVYFADKETEEYFKRRM
jgi:DUF2075 family protein